MARSRRFVLLTVGGVLLVLVVLALGWARGKRRDHGAAETVRPGVVHVRNFFVDVYGFKLDDGKVALVDAGVDDSGGTLDALLGALGATREQVSDLFLTHGHFDHVAFGTLLPKARVHIGIRDADMAAKRPNAPQVPRLARWLSRLWPVEPLPPTAAFLGDRAEVDLGGKTVVALPLPGHTPGSYAFLYDRVLFTGDSITIEGDELGLASGAVTVDAALNRQSVAALEALLGDAPIEAVCTGHQGCVVKDARQRLEALLKRAKSG